MTTNGHEPKPCPFCGERVVWLERKESDTGEILWAVMCPVCEARGPIQDTQDSALAGWDMRLDPVQSGQAG